MDAVTYAKLAWKAGYEVHVDTQYIPPEWLPSSNASAPGFHYEFLRAEVGA